MPLELSRSAKCFKWYVIAFLLCAALVLLVLLSGCHPVIGKVAESVYPDLAQPEEIEAPVTFTSYPSSAATEAILGGQAAGLNCSIPTFADKLAFKHSVGGSDLSLRFRQACVMHDLCYRHGYATYRYTQADCDLQLQQSAFRLCRQVQRQKADSITDVRTMYQSCEKEAKTVLLGVSLAGAGSYQDRTRSTYFEYDPMPDKANDYVVGRAIPENRVSDPDADYGVRTFHFKRNLVRMKKLGEKKQTEQVFAAVPDALLATPPVLTGMGDSDSPPPATLGSLVSLSRDGVSSTEVKLIRYDWLSSSSPPNLTLTFCPYGYGCISKTDASIKKFAVVDGKPTIVSLTHRGTTGPDKIRTVKIVQEEMLKPEERKNDLMTDYPINGPGVLVRNPYRFLSHDMLLEKNAAGEASWAWVFARGAPLNNNNTFGEDDSGKNYTDYITVARQRLGNNHANESQRFKLNVKETDEPLSLIRTDSAGHSELVSMAWSESDLNRVEGGKSAKQAPALKLWQMSSLGSKKEPATLPVNMMPDTTLLTPLIVRLSKLPNPIIVISQVENDRWQHVQTQEQAIDDVFKIDFTVSTIRTDTSVHFENTAKLHCALSLNSQLSSPYAKDLRNRINNILYGTAKVEVAPETISALKSDLAQRWRMSQLIASEREILTDEQKGTTAHMLALTIVFNGFPSMSFQVLFNPKDGGFQYYKTDNKPKFVSYCYQDNK
ncbi:hypothetical protein [Raoultella terrigena]|uniref:hypothetical protein n=1 Tax=Raoultella terrigena TaxID=577 RepID=UPI000A993634|nr:hypothetical protein [Raoultella terrigena]